MATIRGDSEKKHALGTDEREKAEERVGRQAGHDAFNRSEVRANSAN
jgi:hypothetical protein